VPYLDIEMAANAILGFYESPEKLQKASLAIQKRMQPFVADVCAPKLLALIERYL